MAKRRTGTPTGKANISSIIGGKTIVAGRTGGKKSVAQPGTNRGKTIQGGKTTASGGKIIKGKTIQGGKSGSSKGGKK